MARILNIETSTDYCSVSISNNGNCESLKINIPDPENNKTHSELLAVFVNEIIIGLKIKMTDIDAVAISGGPGSYTGLRIGTSTAKGLCFGANLPLMSLNTIQIMATMARAKYSQDIDYIIPMIDARRMEVYTSVFDKNLNVVVDTEAKIIDENSFAEYADKKVLFCGNGASKCKDVLARDNFVFIDGIFPSAEYMCQLAEQNYSMRNFVDLVYYEPFYLKEFVALTSQKPLF